MTARSPSGVASMTRRATARKPKRRVRRVLPEATRAEQLRQLAGREPARQVHLEKAVLGMRVTRGVGQIGARGGGDHRNAARIALDGGFSAERRRVRRAVELRQALAQRPPGKPESQRDADDDDNPGSIAASAAIS